MDSLHPTPGAISVQKTHKGGKMLHKGGKMLPPSPAALCAHSVTATAGRNLGFSATRTSQLRIKPTCANISSRATQNSPISLPCSTFMLLFVTLARQAWKQNNGEMDLITLEAWKRFLIDFSSVYP